MKNSLFEPLRNNRRKKHPGRKCDKYTSVQWKPRLNCLFPCDFSAPEELRSIIQEVKYRTGLQSAKLIRQLKRRDRLCHKLQKNYDIITACLQAVSQKRRKDKQFVLFWDTKQEQSEVDGVQEEVLGPLEVSVRKTPQYCDLFIFKRL